jgi:autoinducer 2-degrading protein
MFAVTVHFEINSDTMQFFLPLMHANARASVETEAGCQQFDVCTDPAHPNVVFLYELYDDEAAFKTHMQQAHFKKFDAETAGMIASKRVTTFQQVMR